MAPPSGPITCPTVMADCIAATCRRTSPGSSALPALMNANVDAAPVTPRTSRLTNSSGNVREAAIRKKPAPCRNWTRT